MKDDPGEAAPTCRFAKDEGGRMKDDLACFGLKNQVILPRSSFILCCVSSRSSFHVHPSSVAA
jgi:hypothetical protein